MIRAHAGTAITATLLVSIVEFVEALTIVLAVGTICGWLPALTGAAAGVGLRTLRVAAFGPALQRVALATRHWIVGTLLLRLRVRWIRNAIVRSAAGIALPDEAAIFAEKAASLEHESSCTARGELDVVAVVTACRAVTLEGLAVISIVTATGASGMLPVAALGATAAGLYQ